MRSYSLKSGQNKEKKGYLVIVIKYIKYEKVMEYKFDYKDIDNDYVIRIVDIKDVLYYLLVIVISKCNIFIFLVDVQIGDNEFKKLEVEIRDDICSFNIIIWGDEIFVVDLQVGKKELFKKLEVERDDIYSIIIIFWED